MARDIALEVARDAVRAGVQQAMQNLEATAGQQGQTLPQLPAPDGPAIGVNVKEMKDITMKAVAICTYGWILTMPLK